MQISVSKYHGCGNDFILLPFERVADWSEEARRDLVIKVCDRHFGIGADGCIFAGMDPYEMIYYNQDGSRADMCGNGIRCLSAWYKDHVPNLPESITIETLAGDKQIQMQEENGLLVEVDMGKPIFDNAKIFVDENEPVWNRPLQVKETSVDIYSFYMGTIHTVVFVEDAFDESLEELGKAICHHPLFSQQTNVNFVQVLGPDKIRAVTWERGCGMTLACGTGMCASAVAALRSGKTGPHLQVEMRRGTLEIEITYDGRVIMRGPAKKIMEGEFYYE